MEGKSNKESGEVGKRACLLFFLRNGQLAGGELLFSIMTGRTWLVPVLKCRWMAAWRIEERHISGIATYNCKNRKNSKGGERKAAFMHILAETHGTGDGRHLHHLAFLNSIVLSALLLLLALPCFEISFCLLVSRLHMHILIPF